ncbi:MAG TPA: NAD(P)-dependent oxidoreductase [Balneolaceae bacterium]|nr:NAD(P)-dependent oxidoreductase [Balneolaceae bacterium]
MNIAIIGASGFVGTALVKEAVRRGHKITAISRHPEEIPSDNDQVTAQSVDINNKSNLADVLEGHDAVLTAFHPGRGKPNEYDEYLKGHKLIQETVKKTDVDRWLVIGGAGSLYNEDGEQLVDTPEFPDDFKTEATAARDYLDTLKQENDLNWTYLSPAILMHPGIDTGRTGEYRTNTETPVFNDKGESKISVEDLAVAMLDELEKGNYIQQRFTVAY